MKISLWEGNKWVPLDYFMNFEMGKLYIMNDEMYAAIIKMSFPNEIIVLFWILSNKLPPILNYFLSHSMTL